MKRFLALFLLSLFCTAGAWAQSALDRARLAYREARYTDARDLLEQHVAGNEADAEAQYLLARVYSETPLADERRARRALDAALRVEPDNVDFLAARMVLLRGDRFTFIEDRLREQRRLELAARILKLDPDNALAHEELGRLYIKDFWRYRNAMALPMLSQEAGRSSWNDETAEPLIAEDGEVAAVLAPAEASISPNSVFLADRFDLDALEAQGMPAISFARRAQKAYSRAIGHLEKALEADPRRRDVYDDFVRIYALKGDWAAALERLGTMYVQFPEDPQTWLYLGLAHTRAGNPAAADRSFRTAFSFMDEKSRAAYEDIQLLLAPDERDRYLRDPDAYAQRFWTSEDPRLLTAYNERRLEHYARLTEADVLYRVPALDLHGWETQRGRILVRYGTPRREVYLIPSNAPGIASMRLRSVLQDFNAAASGVVADLERQQREEDRQDDNASGDLSPGTLRSANTALLGEEPPRDFELLNTYNIWDYGDFQFVFQDPFRNGEFRLYSPSAREIAQGVDPWLNDYTLIAREIEREVPQRYDYESGARSVELPYLVTSFRGEGGATDVYVHYGVSIPEFDAATPQVDVTASVGTFLVSPSRDVLVERRRTLYGLRTDQIVRFDEANLWVDSQKMEAPPGKHELSVEFETASGATVGVQRRPVEVPDFQAGRFSLSDLLLAYRVEEAEGGRAVAPGDIVRGDLSIRPAPWSVFSRNQPLYIYYEAYGLSQEASGQTRYEVEIELAPKDTRKGIARVVGRVFSRQDGVSLRFPGSGTEPDVAQYQLLDVGDQEPGIYTLTLKVRDLNGGASQTRTQDLFLE